MDHTTGNRMGVVYVVYFDELVYYVGSTDGIPEVRFKAHLSVARTNPGISPFASWLSQRLKAKEEVSFRIIDVNRKAPGGITNEKYWIRAFTLLGMPLLNLDLLPNGFELEQPEYKQFKNYSEKVKKRVFQQLRMIWTDPLWCAEVLAIADEEDPDAILQLDAMSNETGNITLEAIRQDMRNEAGAPDSELLRSGS